MAKILLVEDDNNLREIYEARLQAEGYTIVSAMDGEEALVVAKKEKPDLIISDVMMPRISGFEMLDILRNTEGLKHVRVIMLTALGQAEDKTRADSLGADRYLVKSQVTLEDIVKTAQELLNPSETPQGGPQVTAAREEQVAAMAAATNSPAPAATQADGISPPAASPVASATPVTSAAPSAPTVTSVPVVTPPTSASVPSNPPTPQASAPSATTIPDTPDEQPPTVVPPAPPPPEPPSNPPPAPEPPSIPTNNQAANPSPVTPAPAPEPQQPPAPEPRESQAPPSSGPAITATAADAADKTQAQSASDEEQTIKAQIESFVNQNSQTAPKPSEETIMADAIKDLVSGTPAEPAPASAPPKVIEPIKNPATSTNPDPTTAQPEPAPEDDGVAVAHKKVIKPISTHPVEQKAGLDELLAKEGITGLDDDNNQQDAAQPAPAPAPAADQAVQPPSAPALPATPHPPGHVISPNSRAGVDPNSIAL